MTSLAIVVSFAIAGILFSIEIPSNKAYALRVDKEYTLKADVDRLMTLLTPLQEVLKQQVKTGVRTPIDTHFLTGRCPLKVVQALAFVDTNPYSPYVGQGCITLTVDLSSVGKNVPLNFFLHGVPLSSGIIEWQCASLGGKNKRFLPASCQRVLTGSFWPKPIT